MAEHADEGEARRFAEAVGLAYEQAGVPRMAGRILGWLLICDPPHQSQQQLAEGLQASMGSISTMTRLLEQLGLIERCSLPGKRRDFFQIVPHAWDNVLRNKWEQLRRSRELAERGLALLADAPPARRQRLEEMRAIHAFFEGELPRLLDRWEQAQTARERSDHEV